MYVAGPVRHKLRGYPRHEREEVIAILRAIEANPYGGHRTFVPGDLASALTFETTNFGVAYIVRGPRLTEPTTDPVVSVIAVVHEPTESTYLQAFRDAGLIP